MVQRGAEGLKTARPTLWTEPLSGSELLDILAGHLLLVGRVPIAACKLAGQ